MVRILMVILALTLNGYSLAQDRREVDQKSKSEAKTAGGDEFTCTMHPEVRTQGKGKCPKCAMDLVPVLPAIMDNFTLKVEAEPPAPRPNERLKLTFRVYNPKTGEAVKDFALLHEKLFHLFLISQDLTQFQHIHPAAYGDGSFSIETMLPRAGRYMIYCDFYPLEGSPQVLQQSITTLGYKSDLYSSTPKITPDVSLTKVCEGTKITRENAANVGVDHSLLKARPLNELKVELKLEPQQIIAGKPTLLRYQLSDAKTGEAIRDLAPYLGAYGHTLILSEDQTDYVHSHPNELPPDPFDPDIPDDVSLLGGPEVTFEAMFPRPGLYRIWTQFLRGDTITTVTFTVRADRLR